MMLTGERALLRIYLPMADRSPHTPSYERILRQARNMGLAGATVLRGVMGFGAEGMLQSRRWAWTENVPVIVEIVDTPGRLSEFINGVLWQIMVEGTATLERASVVLYRHGKDEEPAALRMVSPQRPMANLPVIERRSNMNITENGLLLRVFIGESDRFEHRALYEVIVQKARELGLAGATVLRGTEGFGARSVVHKAKLLEMSRDLPVVIEMVDAPEKIELLLPHLQVMVKEGMITMEYVCILAYRSGEAKGDAVTPRGGGSF